MNSINSVFLFLFYLLFTLHINAQKVNFKNYSIAEGLPQSEVVDAVQDAIGYIWFATQGGGIAKFDGDRFEVLNQTDGLISNYANAFYLHNKSLFIGTNKGLSVLFNNKFTNFKSPKIHKIVRLNQQIYLATQEGIYQYKYDYVVPIKINLKIDLSEIIDLTYKNAFYWIVTSRDVWKVKTLDLPSTIQKATLNERNAVVDNHQNDIDKLSINPSIKSITKKIVVDRQENTWLLTLGNGVYKSISSSFNHYSNANNSTIKAINATHLVNDSIWFTDSNRNLFLVDSLGVKNIRKNNFKTTSITKDVNNNLWFGSENSGIYIFRKKPDSLLNIRFDIERLYSENGFPHNRIQNIHIQNDTVWVVTKNAGIVKLEYDFENGFVKKIKQFNKNTGIRDLTITTSLLYNNGIWYGTNNGSLGVIENNAVIHYSKILNQAVPISAIQFQDKHLYLGTLGNGIWSADISKINTIKSLNTTFLSSKNTYQLLFDQQQNLWVGSEKGLDRLQLKNHSIIKSTHFNANDGFIGIETSKNTSLKDAQGNLWFGTKNGITKYTPTENQIKHQKPTVYFEKIEVENQPLDSLNLHRIDTVLQLHPEQNHVAFGYKTVDINYPKRIEYQWKLNDDISSWNATSTVNFPNLTSGKYTFSVKSRNGSKQESEFKTVAFFIDTPLYKKDWFIWSVAIIIGLLILMLVVNYVQRLQRKNNAQVEKLTLENHLITLEQKALQLQMNPHFIFNVLNGIKALGNKGDTKELNKTVSQFAVLLRAILQNSRKEEISLSEEIKTLKTYLDLEQQLSADVFDYEIKTATNAVDIEEILIPPMLLQPFVENSIKHAFKGKSDKGKISITFEVKKNHLHCSITDNGIGFVQSQRKKATSDHKSVALKVTKERIKNISKKSTLDISEINEDNQILGTKVEFKIPLKTDY